MYAPFPPYGFPLLLSAVSITDSEYVCTLPPPHHLNRKIIRCHYHNTEFFNRVYFSLFLNLQSSCMAWTQRAIRDFLRNLPDLEDNYRKSTLISVLSCRTNHPYVWVVRSHNSDCQGWWVLGKLTSVWCSLYILHLRS